MTRKIICKSIDRNNNVTKEGEYIKDKKEGCKTTEYGKGGSKIIGQRYMNAKEVAKALQIAESTAYAVTRSWNKELAEMGYFTKAGSVPTAFFKKKCYGFDGE